MPRVVLSAAPEATLCNLDGVAEAVASEAALSPADAVRSAVELMSSSSASQSPNENTPTTNSRASTQPSKIADVLGAMVGKSLGEPASSPKETKSETGSPIAPTRKESLSPNFSLTVWRIESELLVIDTRDVAQALPTDRLLSNILIALGYHLPTLPKPNILKWPMIENASSGQSSDDARDMLHAFLDAQLLLDPVKSIWLMGDAAASHVLPSNFNYADYIGQSEPVQPPPPLESPATPVVVTTSLVDMLLNPSLKAQTWKLVQPLIARR